MIKMDIIEKLNAMRLNDLSIKQWNDFLSGSVYGTNPWMAVAINSGTIGVATTAKHPGIIIFSSNTGANSGYAIKTSPDIILNGGEKTTIIFKTAATLTNVLRRIGFHSTLDSTTPTDGVHCKIQDGVLTGQTANNSTVSTTATNYTLAANTWYRLKIEISADLSVATYTLYADDSNTILWQDSLTTNIPVGRTVGHGDVCTYGGTSAIALGYIDYMDVFLPNARRVV